MRKTNRPFEQDASKHIHYTRYPEESEKVEHTNAKLGCLIVAVIIIAVVSVCSAIIYIFA